MNRSITSFGTDAKIEITSPGHPRKKQHTQAYKSILLNAVLPMTAESYAVWEKHDFFETFSLVKSNGSSETQAQLCQMRAFFIKACDPFHGPNF